MLHIKSMKRFLSVWVAVLHVVMSTSLAVGPAYAQSSETDSEAPVVELPLVDSGSAADAQVFSATVTDDVGVAEVILYHRLQGENDYLRVPMVQIASTNFYSVTIESPGTEATIIEYYINAADTAGNRVLRGFAFDPLLRVLGGSAPITTADSAAAAPSESAEAAATTPTKSGTSTGRKILYGVLGVLVVGAIAAAASSGGDDDPMPMMPEPQTPVTVTISPQNPL